MKKEKIIALTLAVSSITGALSSKAKAKTTETPYIYEEYVYGQSELGRDLTCFHIENEKQFTESKKILLNFAIHGFEDAFDYDGKVLVDIANRIIEYYKEHYDELGTYELYVVNCSNPDGTYEGKTNNGYGRCQSNGIDLNRDFDYYHVNYYNDRNYTTSSFSAVESRALRDLTKKIKPTYVVDCHGWLNGYYGSTDLYYKFSKILPMPYCGGNGSGYYAGWVTKEGAEGMLLEFPWPTGDMNEYAEKYSEKMIEVISSIAQPTLVEQAKLENEEPSIVIDNKEIELKRSSIKLNGVNNYMIKDICEVLSLDLEYQNRRITITDGSNKLELVLDNDMAVINGEPVKLKNEVFVNNNNAFMPIRDLCDLFGYTITWEAETNTIIIDTNNLSKKMKQN